LEWTKSQPSHTKLTYNFTFPPPLARVYGSSPYDPTVTFLLLPPNQPPIPQQTIIPYSFPRAPPGILVSKGDRLTSKSGALMDSIPCLEHSPGGGGSRGLFRWLHVSGRICSNSGGKGESVWVDVRRSRFKSFNPACTAQTTFHLPHAYHPKVHGRQRPRNSFFTNSTPNTPWHIIMPRKPKPLLPVRLNCPTEPRFHAGHLIAAGRGEGGG